MGYIVKLVKRRNGIAYDVVVSHTRGNTCLDKVGYYVGNDSKGQYFNELVLDYNKLSRWVSRGATMCTKLRSWVLK